MTYVAQQRLLFLRPLLTVFFAVLVAFTGVPRLFSVHLNLRDELLDLLQHS